jgi:hypothetical protein
MGARRWIGARRGAGWGAARHGISCW